MGEALVLPTFFVIGAAKSGTTSLNHYLARHPEIAMAEPSEGSLMLGHPWPERARGYATMFRRSARVRGDCSTGYSIVHLNPEASDRIAEAVPEARIVYLVRDPVERAIAHYAQGALRRGESRPIEVALAPGDPESHYVAASRYATQVEAYLRHFDQDRILVVDRERLRTHRREALRHIFEHVGADPDFWDREYAWEYNVRGRDNVRLGPLGSRLRESSLNRLSRHVVPRGARRRVVAAARRLLKTRAAPDVEVTPELRARLTEALAPEADRLRRLTGERFASWSL